MNIIGLFDGLSGGQIALEKVGIYVNKYFASEIDKDGIIVTQANYPNTIQIGDIRHVYYKEHGQLVWGEPQTDDLPRGYSNVKIDLIMGGSPCQDLSSSGKGAGIMGDRSILFFEFVRLLKEIKPKYFLFENVESMKDVDKQIITDHLGVEPIAINSRLMSAQNRRRLYWTNIPGVEPPKDKNIDIHTIIGDDWYCGAMRGRRINPETNSRSDYDKSIPIQQYIECRKDNKTNCLTTVEKDNVVVRDIAPRRKIKEVEYRWLTGNEYEALQTIPQNYTAMVSENKRKRLIGNGWTIDVIAHILSYINGHETPKWYSGRKYPIQLKLVL